MPKERTQFCIECRRETMYRIQRVPYEKCIKGKDYEFEISEAVCENCGEPVSLPGLLDNNAQEVDRQYRQQEGIVSIEDINNLMELYKIGKAPLSLSLGFGEITITRYLSGQVPSKEYSDIIRRALESPSYMENKLNENIDKIGETAYRKAMNAAKEIEPLFALSEKMLLSISYVFKKAEEVTPLALQKMLYYIQAIHMVLLGVELFPEECEAWTHGPVFKDVYNIFKNFKYNPIDDIRFAMFQNRFQELLDDEKKVIDLVVETFGIYSGKTLERITHRESPWMDARVCCLPGEPSNEVISKETIKKYFSEVAQKYNLGNVEGIREYIHSRLQTV